MYPEEGHIALFDRNEGRCGLFRMKLKDAGYSVIGEADTEKFGVTGEISTKAKALQLIPHLGELGVRVTFVDDNLDMPTTNREEIVKREIDTHIKGAYGDTIVTVQLTDTPLEDTDTISASINDDPAEVIKRIEL